MHATEFNHLNKNPRVCSAHIREQKRKMKREKVLKMLQNYNTIVLLLHKRNLSCKNIITLFIEFFPGWMYSALYLTGLFIVVDLKRKIRIGYSRENLVLSMEKNIKYYLRYIQLQ